jgi:hypothetical protein
VAIEVDPEARRKPSMDSVTICSLTLTNKLMDSPFSAHGPVELPC